MVKYLPTSVLLILFVVDITEGGSVTFSSGFENNSTLNENDDSSHDLIVFSASCSYSWTEQACNNSCERSHSSNCNCSIPSSRLFSLTGTASSYTLSKMQCFDTTCGGSYTEATSCLTSNGCANAGTESIEVTCSGSYNYDTGNDSASGTMTHTVTFSPESPTFNITNLPGSASASRTDTQGTVIFSTATTSGLAVQKWEESSPVTSSWLLDTPSLFKLNTTNGQVYINSNLALEYSNTYTMTICAYSRRQEDCRTLSITLSGCFETPTCNDKSHTVADTHTVGGSLFTMTVPNPTGHFTALSSTFQGLSFAIDSTTLGVATIANATGEITTNGSLTVFPSYPSKVYTMVVRVSNTQSCTYTSTCTMTLTANFTNWPIEIRNTIDTEEIHEDWDESKLMFTIITNDNNHPDEDNVTCEVDSNSDSTLFELVANGSTTSPYEYNSYQIWKNVCQDTGCGWLCSLGKGCMSHNITQQYTIRVTCSDAYGSSDSKTFTINIQQNAAPVWTNLPNTITVNTDAVADLDVIYTFYYSDEENEDLHYNYTISPAQPSPSLFSFDSFGNYYNNPANVTALMHQWNISNETYTLYVCGTERRNTICDTLTIQIREFCGPTPSCDDAVNTVTDQFATSGTLFTINAPAPASGSYTSLSYAIFSAVDLFEVDSATGIVTSKAPLPITNPPATTNYSITVNAYDIAACAYAVCHLSLSVTFTNFPINITNMAGVTTNLHEDTKTENTLHTITASDANTDDGYTCILDEANSVPSNNGKFLVRETATGTGVYIILNKEAPGFDYDVSTSYTVAVICSDLYGSSDSATMTVTIDENAQPVITNLPTAIYVDPITAINGVQIFTLTTTDAENDALTYYCNVTNTQVPLECFTDGVVSMRRNVRVPTENGRTYQILMCIADSVHSHTLCETLSVLINSSKTNPEISNLPATVDFDETISIGTVLFSLSVTDPDEGDVHTYTLNQVYPVGTMPMFTFVTSSGVLSLASPLNYETQTTYNFTFSVTDAYLPGLAYKMLYLAVNDINEAPTLTLYTTSLSTREANAGQVIGTVLYECSDVDSGQTLTLSITNGTFMSYFTLSSGQLSFAQNWDYESGSLPEATVLELTCSDGVGLTDAGTLTVSITPVNEFAPVLSVTEIELIIYSNQTLQHSLFSVTATDADYNDDGQFVYSIVGCGEGSQYFTISNTGHVTLKDYLSWTYNHTFRFTVKVSDNETYPLAGSVSVTIHYRAPEADEGPTRPDKCVTCTSEGKLVVFVISFECFLILCFLIHAIITTRMWTLCQSEVIQKHDNRIKAHTKRTHRQQQRKELEDMLKEEGETNSDDGHGQQNTGYSFEWGSLNQAIPITKVPGPSTYNRSNLPNMITDLPEPATYNRYAISASAIPEPQCVPDTYKAPKAYPRQNIAFVDLTAFDNPVGQINKQAAPSCELAKSPDPEKLYNRSGGPTGFGRFLGTDQVFNQTGSVLVSFQGQHGSSNIRRKRKAPSQRN